MKRSGFKVKPRKQLARSPFKRLKTTLSGKRIRKGGKLLTVRQTRHLREILTYGRKLWSLTKADQEFSKWIRKRDGKCVRCGSTEYLTCSHFWARQHKATRFDPENCVTLCWMPCHKYHWEKEKQGAYRDFMLSWLGEERYTALEARSKATYPQIDAIRGCMILLGIIEKQPDPLRQESPQV